jgi:hypothetical protein
VHASVSLGFQQRTIRSVLTAALECLRLKHVPLAIDDNCFTLDAHSSVMCAVHVHVSVCVICGIAVLATNSFFTSSRDLTVMVVLLVILCFGSVSVLVAHSLRHSFLFPFSQILSTPQLRGRLHDTEVGYQGPRIPRTSSLSAIMARKAFGVSLSFNLFLTHLIVVWKCLGF